MESFYEIAAQTRTLYFSLNKEVKYKLNLPRLLVKYELANNIVNNPHDLKWYVKNWGQHLWTIKAINENNQLCWTPLPNIMPNNVICLGYSSKYPKNIVEFKQQYYNSLFSCSGLNHLKYYLNTLDIDNIIMNRFYIKWQYTGKLELKLID